MGQDKEGEASGKALESEIATLKSMIRAKLSWDGTGLACMEAVRRCVDSLGRAFRFRQALRQGQSDVDDALREVLDELMDELEPGTVHRKRAGASDSAANEAVKGERANGNG